MLNFLGKSAAASVGVVLLKVLVGGSVIVIGGHSFTVGAIDSGTIAAILTPTLGAYVASLHHTMDDEDAPKKAEG